MVLFPHRNTRTSIRKYQITRFTDIEIHLGLREIGYVISIKQSMVVSPRITLWKQEWFGSFSLIVDMRDIETGVTAITTFADKYKPTRVATLVVITLTHIAVHCSKRIRLASLQIHHPQICIWLYYREITSTTPGIHQPFTIIRWSSQHITHIRLRTIEKRIHLFAKGPCLGIERNAYQRALHLLILCRYSTTLGSTII